MAVLALSVALAVLAIYAAVLAARLAGSRREAARLRAQLARHAEEMQSLRRADAELLERLPDPLIVLDAGRNVRRANAAARGAFGADIGAVLRHPGLRAAIDRALAERGAHAAELSLPVPVAHEVHAEVVALEPPLADGGRILAVLSDRTPERAAERMRADFVANASHELRTPLASLIGFIDTLRGPAADDAPAQRRFLAIMAEQAARMGRLIDDLLALSRIELSEHLPPAGRVDPGALLASLAAMFEPRFAERGVRLDLAVPTGLAEVGGDADQLAQVLQNLLENALIHGGEGKLIRLSAMSEAGGVRIAVADAGPGIGRHHLPRLTERFYRVDNARSRAAGGTGLGLAIVKHIVGRHRGRLHIDSTEGKGTTVSVWLPPAR